MGRGHAQRFPGRARGGARVTGPYLAAEAESAGVAWKLALRLHQVGSEQHGRHPVSLELHRSTLVTKVQHSRCRMSVDRHQDWGQLIVTIDSASLVSDHFFSPPFVLAGSLALIRATLRPRRALSPTAGRGTGEAG